MALLTLKDRNPVAWQYLAAPKEMPARIKIKSKHITLAEALVYQMEGCILD